MEACLHGVLARSKGCIKTVGVAIGAIEVTCVDQAVIPCIVLSLGIRGSGTQALIDATCVSALECASIDVKAGQTRFFTLTRIIALISRFAVAAVGTTASVTTDLVPAIFRHTDLAPADVYIGCTGVSESFLYACVSYFFTGAKDTIHQVVIDALSFNSA